MNGLMYDLEEIEADRRALHARCVASLQPDDPNNADDVAICRAQIEALEAEVAVERWILDQMNRGASPPVMIAALGMVLSGLMESLTRAGADPEAFFNALRHSFSRSEHVAIFNGEIHSRKPGGRA